MIFTISSKDRSGGLTTSSSNFTVNLPLTIKAKKLSLLELDLPNSIYNVDSTNNILPINDGTTNINVVITPGAYSITNLVNQIQTQLNTSSTGFSVSYSSNTMQVTISRSSNFYLRFGSVSGNISYLIGFSNSNTTSNTSFTGTNVIILNSPMSIYLRLNDFINGYTTNGLQYSFRQTICVNPGNIIIDEKINLKPYTLELENERSFQTMNISLFKSDGTPLNLNGSDFEIVLKIE